MNWRWLPAIFACSVVPIAAGAGRLPAPQTADPISWSAMRQLDWRDFRAKAPGDLQGARSVLSYNYRVGCRDAQLHFSVTALFLPDQSWVAYRIVSSGLASRVGLRHEQTHFDLKEVYARRARKMFAELATRCPRSDDDLNALAERVFRDEAAIQRRFDIETRSGENEAKQIEWEKRVAAGLDALKAFTHDKPGTLSARSRNGHGKRPLASDPASRQAIRRVEGSTTASSRKCNHRAVVDSSTRRIATRP